ncbi:myosin-1B-like isoform X2 [Leucoraja erinacea]|uniref:myosin-1B-like isoform X2 n=1 Tax=Leucoraja erinaceus TaxID=7782 RepID=UPI0024572D35|nr:myosin-1B-like isoform X2 [Leucoraja erinacea]
MADLTTGRGWLHGEDWHHSLGARGSWCGKEFLRSSPLTLKDLGRSYEEVYRASGSPFHFQDPLNRELESFSPSWPGRGGKELRSRSVSPTREGSLRCLDSTRRLYYSPFDTSSATFPDGAVDIGPFDHMMIRRPFSSCHFSDTCLVEDPLRSLSEGLGSFDVDLKVSLLDSGRKRAQLLSRLKETHRLLEEQSAQLRKREGQLSDSKTQIEMLSLKQKQLENSISQLEEEKNSLELTSLEDQKKSGSLKEKLLHLEVEMAKAKSTLDVISRDHKPMPSSPSRTLSWVPKSEDAVKQEKESLLRERQPKDETLRIYKERAQQSVLVKSNEANQRLTDSLRAQADLHEELNDMRLKYNKAGLARDLLAAKLERLEESVTNLKTKLEDVAADKDRFLQEKVDLHKCVQHLTLELERALRGREGFDDQVSNLHEELLTTKSQANRQDQEKIILKEKLAATSQVNEKLSGELGELRQTLGLRQERLHHLEAEKKLLTNQVEALDKERSQLVGENGELLATGQVDNKAHREELQALVADCTELRASEGKQRARCKSLEAELQQKVEELTMVTLEQGQVAQQWKERWNETSCALRAKEKALQLAALRQLTKKEKAELLGDCEIFAADLEELIELRTELARVTAEKAQLRRQQEESGRIIDLLQLQKDISSDSALRGSSRCTGGLDSVRAELQKNRNQIQDLEKEKGEMEMELKKFKMQSAPLVRVELDACRQQLELERSRSSKLQHQVQELQRSSRPQEQGQARVVHKVQGRQAGTPSDDPCVQEAVCNNEKNKEESIDHLEDIEEPPSPEFSVNSIAGPQTQELLKEISALQQDLRESKTTQRQQNAIIRGLREELEEANLNKPREIKASLEEVDGELFQVREELQKVWDMLHTRDSKLEEQHQELESARGQFSECNSENQRLENLVTALKQQVSEKEHTLRQHERFQRTEKTEFDIKISALELKLAEVAVMGEARQEIPIEEGESRPLQKCLRCDSFLEKMNSKAQGFGEQNTQLQEERTKALKSLNETQVRTQGLENTVDLEQQLTQTLEGENSDLCKRSQRMSEQLLSLTSEQKDLTKAYGELPEELKGETSVEYWAPRSHLVQNVGEMVKAQEEEQRAVERQSHRLKERAACQNFHQLQEEMHQLQHQLDSKRQKMATMACEMESLKHKNEDLVKAQAGSQHLLEKDWRRQASSLALTGLESRTSDGQQSSPWAAHSFQEFKPFNRRGRDLSPYRREELGSSAEASGFGVRSGHGYLEAVPSDQSPLGAELALRPEVWFGGAPTSPLWPRGASMPDRSPSPLPPSRTPSPPRHSRSVSPLNIGRPSRDFSSASDGQSEEEKMQGRMMSSAVKCSLLLSPRPFNMHRMNLNKK